MSELLELRRLCKNFSGLHVLKDIDLTVRAGERRAIIGPNGAGKTTLFNVVSGELQPSSGSVLFEGQEVTGKAPNQMWAVGLARTFQRTWLLLRRQSATLQLLMIVHRILLGLRDERQHLAPHRRELERQRSKLLERPVVKIEREPP